jgi:anti-sigma factor RsiW
MPCEAFRDLLHAYLDGELDLVHGLEVERHLAGCPACARSCEDMKALGGAMRSLLPPLPPPPSLQQRLVASLRQGEPTSPSRPPRWGRRGFIMVGAAALLGSAALTWFLLTSGPPIPPTEEVIASHLRSQMGDNQVDFKSGDPAAVRRWLADRLDFAPLVPEPSRPEDSLVGARREFLDRHTAAALVYRHGGRLITVLTWPDDPKVLPSMPVVGSQRGYSHFRWSKEGMVFWAVSDLDGTSVMTFVVSLGALAPHGCKP